MMVFCGRENERAIFTCKRDGDFPLDPLLTSMDVCRKEVVFVASDTREGKTVTITLPATIVQEMYAMGRLKFEK